MPATAAHIEGRALIGEGEPVGVPFDRDDAPQLARDLDALAGSLKCARPDRIVFTPEFAVRLHVQSGWFGRPRRTTLALGWPLLQVLDADELRAAAGLALAGSAAHLGASDVAACDARVADRVGRPLLARTLTRLLVAEAVGADSWWDDWNLRARREATAPAQALDQLRRKLESRGRGGWQGALDQLLETAPDLARLQALGGADLGGGSHRCAAAALLWDGMVSRLWTALEVPFAALLAPQWQACFDAHACHRERARELDARRRDGCIDMDALIELAECVERLAGGRAAYTLYREAYARERRPQLVLALARTLISIDRERAREALIRLAASPHPLASEAQRLLLTLAPLYDSAIDRSRPMTAELHA